MLHMTLSSPFNPHGSQITAMHWATLSMGTYIIPEWDWLAISNNPFKTCYKIVPNLGIQSSEFGMVCLALGFSYGCVRAFAGTKSHIIFSFGIVKHQYCFGFPGIYRQNLGKQDDLNLQTFLQQRKKKTILNKNLVLAEFYTNRNATFNMILVVWLHEWGPSSQGFSTKGRFEIPQIC